MHNSAAQRVGSLSKEEQAKYNLPPDTHLVSGTIEADSAAELCSERAKLSSRVLKLERTASGGISYELAIYASEPVKAEAPAPGPSEEDAAIEFLRGKGYSLISAKQLIAEFGLPRIQAQIAKEKEEAFGRAMNPEAFGRAMNPDEPESPAPKVKSA